MDDQGQAQGDGESFGELLERADLLQGFIARELVRGRDVTAAVAMLDYADSKIRADLAQGYAAMQGGGA